MSDKGKSTRYPGVRKLPDGRWRVLATVTHPLTGRQIERMRVLPPGLALDLAVSARAELLRQMRAELEAEVRAQREPAQRLTVADYTEQWAQVRAPRLKPSTRARYLGTLADHILPQLGELQARSVTRADVERWARWAEQQRQPSGAEYARDTVTGWWTVIKTLLRDMAADVAIPDPTARVRGPETTRSRVHERTTLSREECKELLSMVRDSHPAWYAEVYVARWTGVRAGELYALEWPDVDFARKMISVRHAVWRGEVGSPKTGKVRTVPMSAEMIKVLKAHRAKQVKAQHPGLEQGLVFPADHGGHRYPTALAKVLREASALAKLPIVVTPKILRRSLNTQLLELGLDPIAIRSILGHESESMTERYAGVRDETKRKAIEQLQSS